MSVCIYVHFCVCVCVCVCVCMHGVCVYVYFYVCVFVCAYVFVHKRLYLSTAKDFSCLKWRQEHTLMYTSTEH